MSAAEPRREVVVDQSRCIGSGQCTFYASGTFDLDEDNHSYVVDQAGDSPDKVDAAVEGCPANALSYAKPAGAD
jgi:ferredoxin